VLKAVKIWGGNFQHASERLRNDKEIYLVANESCRYAIYHASDELKKCFLEFHKEL